MEYTQLGKTGITISKVCVGCMSFGKAGTMHDWTLDEAESEQVIRHALDLGINFFDTANGYSAGTSEEYLGRALKKNAARDHGWTPFSVMQNHYNLLYREDERELIPICRQMGVSLMPYSPLAAGHLTRPTWTSDSLRARTDRVAMGKYDRTEAQDMQIVAHVHELAERKGCKLEVHLTPEEVAWLEECYLPHPIVGAVAANPPEGVVLLDEKK